MWILRLKGLTRTHWYQTGTHNFSQDESEDSPQLFVTKTLYIYCKLTSCSARKKLLYRGTYRGISVRAVVKGLNPKHLFTAELTLMLQVIKVELFFFSMNHEFY